MARVDSTTVLLWWNCFQLLKALLQLYHINDNFSRHNGCMTQQQCPPEHCVRLLHPRHGASLSIDTMSCNGSDHECPSDTPPISLENEDAGTPNIHSVRGHGGAPTYLRDASYDTTLIAALEISTMRELSISPPCIFSPDSLSSNYQTLLSSTVRCM